MRAAPQAGAARVQPEARRIHAQGYRSRWQAARKAFLAEHLFCRMCSRPERPVAATVVDHVRPHKGDQALFWDRSNWQALCWRCHSRKTATEDGRWRPK